jgi:hypothetical protein
MSEIDPLIKRELDLITVSVSESRDLAPIVIAKVRRQRILRFVGILASFVLVGALSIFGYELLRSEPSPTSSTATSDNTSSLPKIIGVETEFPIAFEQSVGTDTAISGAVAVGDEVGGLYASGLKVEWGICGAFRCPLKWTLVLENRGKVLVSVKPGISIFVDHQPYTSDYRPTSVLPGDSVRLIFEFNELKDNPEIAAASTWQWNWFLAR